MRCLLRILGILVAVVALTIAALYLFIPAHERPEDGSADPVLGVRRPIVGLLRDLGIARGRVLFFRDPLLPSATGTTYYKPGRSPTDSDEEGNVARKVSVQWEPVYRGLLWPVGDRVTYRNEFLGDDRREIRSMQLWYEEGGRREVAGVGTVENGHVDPSGHGASVQGYVPRTATAHGVEIVLSDGTVTDGESWGRSEVEPHE